MRPPDTTVAFKSFKIPAKESEATREVIEVDREENANEIQRFSLIYLYLKNKGG
jgi:hypothetical protein